MIVHLGDNLFKIFLVGKSANKKIIMAFGIPAVIAALLGAFLLNYTAVFPVIVSYNLGGHVREITLVKLVIGLIIVIFSSLEMSPGFQKISFDQKYLSVGCVIAIRN